MVEHDVVVVFISIVLALMGFILIDLYIVLVAVAQLNFEFQSTYNKIDSTYLAHVFC